MNNNQYKLEIIDNRVVARIYINDIKTSAYTTSIPESLKSKATSLHIAEDNKPF